jgi:hypothetical protein
LLFHLFINFIYYHHFPHYVLIYFMNYSYLRNLLLTYQYLNDLIRYYYFLKLMGHLDFLDLF